MGWSVHESRRKITYLRPNAKWTTAKKGLDKFENQTDLLNSLTDEEFAKASKLADISAVGMSSGAGERNEVTPNSEESDEEEEEEEEDNNDEEEDTSMDSLESDDTDSEDLSESSDDDEDGDASEDEDDSVKWKVFDDLLRKHGADIEQLGWPQLEEAGWLYSTSHKLYNVLYVAPGFTHKTATIEETMFEDVYDLQDKLRKRKQKIRKHLIKNKGGGNEIAKHVRGVDEGDDDEDNDVEDEEEDVDEGERDDCSSSMERRIKTRRAPKTPHGVSTFPRCNYRAIDEALDAIGTNLDMNPLDIFREDLKPLGWKYVKGDLLHNYYYLGPGVNKKTGTMGLTKFPRLEAVIDALKSRRSQLKKSRTARRQKKDSRDYVVAAAAAAAAIDVAASDSDSDCDMAESSSAIAGLRAQRASAAVALAAVDEALAHASDDDDDDSVLDNGNDTYDRTNEEEGSVTAKQSNEGQVVAALASFSSPQDVARETRQRNRNSRRSGASSSSKNKKINSLDLALYHPSFREAVAKVQDLSTTNKVWKDLRKLGWKYKSMGGIMGSMYLCPNVSKRDGKLNYDMFEDLDDVIKIIEHNQGVEEDDEEELEEEDEEEETEDDDSEEENDDHGKDADSSAKSDEEHHPAFLAAVEVVCNLTNPWSELQSLGWKYKAGPLSVGGNMVYFAPGAKKNSAVLGYDMFTDLEMIRQIMFDLGWRADSSDEDNGENDTPDRDADSAPSLIARKVAGLQMPFQSPVGAARGTRNRRKTHGITASTRKALRVYSPPVASGSNSTEKGGSQYHPSFYEAVEKVYNLDQPWSELQSLGWKYKSGPMAVGGNMAYFAPGATKKQCCARV
jgi:ribonuclease E